MDEYNLIDNSFQGDPFTCKQGSLSQRLDRVPTNLELKINFLEVVVKHLPTFKSNHCPLLLQLAREAPLNKGCRPFRFLQTWLTRETFADLLANA